MLDLDHVTVFGGAGIAVVVVLWLALVVLLPKAERRSLRMPGFFILVHVGLLAARGFLEEGSEPDGLLRLAEVFFLTMALARCSYLLLLRLVVQRVLGSDVPRILRDLIQAIFFAGALLITLRFAGVEPSALFTTSALLTAVIGFALQDTLGNLFAGLAIQAQRPFRVGDWIQWDDADERTGRVVEMNWRAVKVVTIEHVEMTLPNATLAKSALRNFSAPSKEARRKVYIYAPYSEPPARVCEVLRQALEGVDGVERAWTPTVVVKDFTERGVEYEVRYFIRAFDRRDHIDGEVRMRLWYALTRMGVSVPAPMRNVQLHEVTEETLEHEEELRVDGREAALRNVDFLDALPAEVLHQLAEAAERRLFAPGEPIIRQGEHGEELFVIIAGEVAVYVKARGKGRGPRREVSRLHTGQFFGEMSLMTGQMRAASVSACSEVEVMVLGKAALQPVLEAAPELAETVTQILSARVEELTGAEEHITMSGDPRAPDRGVLLARIKKFFSLDR